MIEESLEVEKTWGWEKWFVNIPLYCGKMLFVKYGYWSSKGRYHYHKVKDETFITIEGTLILDYYDENNEYHSQEVETGQSIRILPGIKHRFTSKYPQGCKFIEVSTTHDEEDSYRCEIINGEWTE